VTAERPAANRQEPVPTENLQARVQEAQRILDTCDADQIIAWILDAPVEEVRRVSGS
jgi:hypothetical protein